MARPLDWMLPVEMLRGLRRMVVEVSGNGRVRDCVKDGCLGRRRGLGGGWKDVWRGRSEECGYI